MLDSKYGGWRNLDDNKRIQPASKWWYDLSSIYHNSGEDNWFKYGIKWCVGFASEASFWEDGWMVDGTPLMVKVP